ncbi:MAG: hypothetical protein J3K34DRAFT_195407 [Monoraphidium minutum]|nr:MAG: hypothetical protein J3K34DRAFT_195407 [Monoraphidium minutum]
MCSPDEGCVVRVCAGAGRVRARRPPTPLSRRGGGAAARDALSSARVYTAGREPVRWAGMPQAGRAGSPQDGQPAVKREPRPRRRRAAPRAARGGHRAAGARRAGWWRRRHAALPRIARSLRPRRGPHGSRARAGVVLCARCRAHAAVPCTSLSPGRVLAAVTPFSRP